MGQVAKKSHLHKLHCGGFKSERDRLLYLLGMATGNENETCLNMILNQMDKARKEMILAILNDKY